MKKIFALTFLLLSIVAFSQDNYISGYYIDQSGKKNEGFIEDTNPSNNPEKINFKTLQEDKAVEISIDNIKEFKINNSYKYVKYTVDYDYEQVVNKSEINVYGKEPNLKKKTILLKVLVEGKSTLYKATIGDCSFFYFKNTTDETPKLLIHRKYNVSNSISENNDFRRQLYDDMKTEALPINEFLNLEFEESKFIAIFKKANNQDNSLVEQNINTTKYKNKVYYKIFAGVSSFSAPHTYMETYDLKPKNVSFSDPILGFELSNVFGTNSRRSEIFGRLFYQSSKVKSTYYAQTNAGYDIDYIFNSKLSTINITGGYRYAIIQTGKSKFTIDGSLGVTNVLSKDVTLDYLVTYTGPNPNPQLHERYLYDKFGANLFFNLGLGYVFNNKYGINVEYSLPKNYLNKYKDLIGDYSNINLMFTYILNK